MLDTNEAGEKVQTSNKGSHGFKQAGAGPTSPCHTTSRLYALATEIQIN